MKAWMIISDKSWAEGRRAFGLIMISQFSFIAVEFEKVAVHPNFVLCHVFWNG